MDSSRLPARLRVLLGAGADPERACPPVGPFQRALVREHGLLHLLRVHGHPQAVPRDRLLELV